MHQKSQTTLKLNWTTITQDTVDGNLRLVRFAETPIMSTYLVAIVVGEFEASESKTKDNITVGGTKVNTYRMEPAFIRMKY